jgi:hypothetical protein
LKSLPEGEKLDLPGTVRCIKTLNGKSMTKAIVELTWIPGGMNRFSYNLFNDVFMELFLFENDSTLSILSSHPIQLNVRGFLKYQCVKGILKLLEYYSYSTHE